MKEYYFFLDECGHHGLKTIDQEFPILLLCGCLIEKDYFDGQFTQEFNRLKLSYFGNSNIVFHSRDIRKWQNEFRKLGDPRLRNRFYQDFDKFVGGAEFKIIASAIIKNDLIKNYGPRADNPYDLSLTFILERVIFLTDIFGGGLVHVVAEARGKKEDANLQSQYQLILTNGTAYVASERLENRISGIAFSQKKDNNLGIQLSDLVAYPLATKIIYPNRENFAFRVIDSKIYRQFPDGDYMGYGLKIFP